MKLFILKILNRVEGDGLSATTLRLELEIMQRRRPGETELVVALGEMRDGGLVICEEDDLTGDTVWKLTPAGTARARKS